MGTLTLYERMEKIKGSGSASIEYFWNILPFVEMNERALISPILTRNRAKEGKHFF
jgi:hypothetical protein